MCIGVVVDVYNLNVYITIYTHVLLSPIQSNPNSRFSLIFFNRFADFSHAVFFLVAFLRTCLPPFTTPVVHSQPCKRISFYIIQTAIYNGERAGEHTRGEEKDTAAADRYVAADGSVSVADARSRMCYLILSKDVKAKTLITPLKMPI